MCIMQNQNEDCVRYANNNYNICQTRHQDDKKGNGGPLNNGLVNEMFNHILISSSEFVQSVNVNTGNACFAHLASITTTNALRIHYDFHEMTQSQSVFSCEQSVISLNLLLYALNTACPPSRFIHITNNIFKSEMNRTVKISDEVKFWNASLPSTQHKDFQNFIRKAKRNELAK